MTTILYIFFGVCYVFLSGCYCVRQTQENRDPDIEAHQMIQIQNFTLTERNLSFDYKVSNPFAEDIRVCQDINVYGNQHVATIIDAETVRIQLRLNIERDKALRDPPAIAKYLRMPPGESYSGRILLNLPIRNASPVNYFPEEEDKERMQIVLHRVVFEVGYFGIRLNKGFEVIAKTLKEWGIKGDIPIDPVSGLHDLRGGPVIKEEIQNGQSCEVVYINEGWSTIKAEEFAKVVITDVDVPCSIAVDQ